MKIKVSKIVPAGFIGITLWPFGIFVSEEKYLTNQRLIRHEKIHWEQQKEMLGLFFYLWYGIEWLIKFIFSPLRKRQESAYEALSFEREANYYEDYEYYLEERKIFAWFRFMID